MFQLKIEVWIWGMWHPLNSNSNNIFGYIAQLHVGQVNAFCESQLSLYLMPAMCF